MSLPAGWSHLHASAVARDGKAALLLGASGSGKSGLALQLLGIGAALVSDDQVLVRDNGDDLELAPPDPLCGLIEARGVGLLTVPYIASATAVLAVDLERAPDARLPQPRTRLVEGHQLPLIWGKSAPNLAQVLWLLLRCSKSEIAAALSCPSEATASNAQPMDRPARNSSS